MAGIVNEFAEVNDCHGYIVECVQHLPGPFTTVVPWLSGAQHKELTRNIGTEPTGVHRQGPRRRNGHDRRKR